MTKANWNVNPANSNVNFSVNKMIVSSVYGAFRKFNASIEADPVDLTTANIHFNIDVSSIKTHNTILDAHLRSNLFDYEQFPTITFISKNIVKKDTDEYDIYGLLTVRGLSRYETFNISINRSGKNSCENEKVIFSSKGQIHRNDYGLSLTSTINPFGFLIGDKISIFIQVEALKE
ncbi:YceI family protein [Paenibacillus sp. BSR1-1]|uniref:YceI family protein n=1 Tax=Paenibacillus sp. BSR1-1 TaxID=3020845 RepID=UPI0025AFB463|nr:YceI family protein [Paenibacillus sp. BSR1-1]MDN3019508.1 YceI family protein [Paenibacillus sp. BSR1-1]